jgi:hypothetical protein
MSDEDIQVKLNTLSEDLRREVLDYVEFLLIKYQLKKKKSRGLQFDWEGGLSEIKNKFTSVQLQHKALQLR